MTRSRRAGVLFVMLLGLLLAAGLPAAAQQDAEPVLYFWGDGCPFCELQAEFLDELEQQHPDVVVERYEVWNDAANQQLMIDTLGALGVEATGVPATVIGAQYWVGFNDRIGDEIRAAATVNSNVTVTGEVSEGPEPDAVLDEDGPDEQPAEQPIEAQPIEPIAAIDADEGSRSAGVAIGLGVAFTLVAVVVIVAVLLRQRQAPANRPPHR